MRFLPSGTRRARRSGALRAEPSLFFGRAKELAKLDAPLTSGPLVTVVGPRGIGKTRLALRYATTRRGSYTSVWFCDVSDTRNVEEMTRILLHTLAWHEPAPASSADAMTALTRALGARAGALVILDHVEHLLPAAITALHRWIAAAPDVRFVVTSRVSLDLDEEHVVALAAMPIPPPGATSGDAIDLFVGRVRSRKAAYTPGDAELLDIAELVRRLEGVPLAIELAAARVSEEDPRSLLLRVGDTGSALQRAFALLTPLERKTLAQCSVFRGVFSLQAAEHVLRVDAPAEDAVLDLARRDLLRVERFQPIRFSMCNGIRSLAADYLDDDDAEAVRQRHANHFLERAIAIDGSEAPADGADDRGDLLAAMAFDAATGRTRAVLRMALAVDALASGAGLGTAQLATFESALRVGTSGDAHLLARSLGVHALALHASGRLAEAKAEAEQALQLATELCDRPQMGAMMRAAADAASQLGDLDAAAAALASALNLERDRGDVVALAIVHRQLGDVASSGGDLDAARREFETSLALCLRSANAAGEARALMGLAWCSFENGDHAAALRSYERALEILRRLRLVRSERIVIGYVGMVHFDTGDFRRAEETLSRAAFASRQAGDFRVEGIFEGVRAAVLAVLDRLVEARASFELADQLLVGNAFYASAIAIHRGHLDLAEARAARARGDADAADTHIAMARSRNDAARAPGPNGTSLVQRSDDARLALRILEGALDLV